MKVGILSNPSNFHCKKWANALSNSGADIYVFTMEEPMEYPDDIQFEIIHIPSGISKNKGKIFFPIKNKLTYSSFYKSFNELKSQIKKNKIDLLHPLHLTPFGTWARLTGFHPTIGGAMGADVLEYPPEINNFFSKTDTNIKTFDFLRNSSWDDPGAKKLNQGYYRRLIKYLKKRIFRYEVAQTTKFCDAITADNQTLVNALHHWFRVPLHKIHQIKWGLKEEIYGMNPLIYAKIETVLNILNIEFKLPLKKSSDEIFLLIPRGIKPIYQIDIISEGLEKYFNSQIASRIKVIILSAGYEISNLSIQKINYLSDKFIGKFFLINRCLDEFEMRAIWEISDMFISAPIYDGYSSSVAEGRILGKIPLVNKIPAYDEIFRHLENAILVDPFSSENLVQALHLLEDQFDSIKDDFKKINMIQMRKEGWIKDDAENFLKISDHILRNKK